YRDEAVDAAHPLRVVLGSIATGVALTRLPLAPLSYEAVAELAEPFGVDAEELHEVTGGNPFFVTEVIASGGAEIPATVRDAVLRFAPAAGAYAASVGAHREAAEQYARALRHADALEPREVAELLRRRSRECYLTDQADEAIDALQRAVEVYRELGDRAKIGE